MITALIYGIPTLILIYLVVVALVPWETKRKIRNRATYGLGILATVTALIPLFMLLSYLIKVGGPGLNATFFTQTQKPLGEPGSGMIHAIYGSLLTVGIASAVGIPIGVLAGIYLAEIGKGKFAAAVRFLSEVLTGLPSIVAGILAYAIFVAKAQPQYSAIAGGFALSFLMIPVITRVTEEAIKLVPGGLREASYGLGSSQLQTVWRVVLPSARGAILTGVVLSIARVMGETAPLLFTAAGQSSINWNPNQATAALPLSIFLNANQPFPDSQQLAVTGALFLVLWIAGVNLAMRWLDGKLRKVAAA